MKNFYAAIALFLASGLANAAIPGPYMGVGIGSSTARTSDSDMFASNASNSHERGGISGKLLGGYNFNKYFGLEAAYSTYAVSTYQAAANNMDASLKYLLDAVSLTGKGYFPLDDSGFNAYVLGGIAGVRNQVRYNNNGIPLASDVTANFKNGTTYYNSLRPIYGIGISYDTAEHVTTSLEISRIQGEGNVRNSASATPNADMASFNISYNFN